jgi:hypothetical protein
LNWLGGAGKVATMRKPVLFCVALLSAAVAAWAVWHYCFRVEPDPLLRDVLPGTWEAGDPPTDRAPVVIYSDGRYRWPRRDSFTKNSRGDDVPDLQAVVEGKWRWVDKDAIELDGGTEATPERIYLEIRDKGDHWELWPGWRGDSTHQYWTGFWVRKK